MTVICKTCHHEMMFIAHKGRRLRDYRCRQCGGSYRRATAMEERTKRRRVLDSMTRVQGVNDGTAA